MGWSRNWKRINSKRKLWNNLGCSSITNRSFEIHGIEVSCIKNHKLWCMQFEYTSYWNSLQYFPMVEVLIHFNNILHSFQGKYIKTDEISSSCYSQFWENFDQTHQVTVQLLKLNLFKHDEFLVNNLFIAHWVPAVLIWTPLSKKKRNRYGRTVWVAGEVILSVLSF